MLGIKPIAIHLPQFHPIPENNEWWEKGFTEWTNVVKATPRFEGHYQPHLPADLGFYDLRLEEARMAQEALAKEYGIEGFCYYHYWFNGKRLLYEPLDRKLKNPKEDFPFMLCWANENWTRAWDGKDTEVLLHQDYNEGDDEEHMTYLCTKFFKDPRYIKIDGKPVFIVYRPKLFADIAQTVNTWREVARKLGVGELHLGYMQSWGLKDDPSDMGFDFAVDFQPNFTDISRLLPKKPITLYERIVNRIKWEFGIENSKPSVEGDRVYQYSEFVGVQKKFPFKANVCPGITPMWDNSARRKTMARIITNSTPELYEDWLKHIADNYPWEQSKEKFLFINAWNEWAEGNHLEPCQKWGKAYLEKTKKVLGS